MVATKPRPFPGTSQRTAPLRGSMFPIFLKIRFSFVPFVVLIFMQYRPSTEDSFLPIDLELLFCLLSSLLNTSPIRFVPLSFYFPNKIQLSSIVIGHDILAYFVQFGPIWSILLQLNALFGVLFQA